MLYIDNINLKYIQKEVFDNKSCQHYYKNILHNYTGYKLLIQHMLKKESCI